MMIATAAAPMAFALQMYDAKYYSEAGAASAAAEDFKQVIHITTKIMLENANLFKMFNVSKKYWNLQMHFQVWI